jgi:DMSO/TMAO reductase YedYZ molybdopterin-dependent catalytic subunit
MTNVAFPQVGDGSFIEAGEGIHREELQLAFRNKAIPLEALRYDVTPTGMHYTLIHYDIPTIDPAEWRLRVGGQVRSPLVLSLDELLARAARTIRVTMECAGDGRALTRPRSLSQPWLTGAVGTADWTGCSLGALLRDAGIKDGATEVLFTGRDEGFEGGQRQFFQRSLPLRSAQDDGVILAWAMNGAPLEPQHGFPLRVIVPRWYGMAHVKWLGSIEVLAEPFQGYQQAIAYRFGATREELGDPVTLMRVRSLMIPPGVPDFLTRTRVLDRGDIELRGRAWSGASHVDRVQVSVDAATTWADANLDPPDSPQSWQSWRYLWNASMPGHYELCCRADDAAGNTQPLDQFWTARGMGNNAVHRVPVIVV